MIYYANADKTKLVAEDDPTARYVVNDAQPGEFVDLVEAEKKASAKKEEAKAEKPDADEAKPARTPRK